MRCLKICIPFILLSFFGCKTTSYFNSSNDLADKESTVTLLNGTQKSGMLTIQFETGNSSNKMVLLKDINNQVEKILIDSIKCYKTDNVLFYPKEIDLGAYEITYRDKVYLPNVRNILFVKKLTREDVRIDLFELYQSRNNTLDGAEHFYYFISLNKQDRLSVSNMGSVLFFPDFNEKLSKIVMDCPLLADKIKQKYKGYAVGQFSVDLKKIEVFKRIIDEYNNCK